MGRLHHEFRARGHGHGGILILPRRAEFELRLLRAAMMLDWLGTLGDHRSQLFRWGALQQLLIGGYRLPGYTDKDVDRALGRG